MGSLKNDYKEINLKINAEVTVKKSKVLMKTDKLLKPTGYYSKIIYIKYAKIFI